MRTHSFLAMAALMALGSLPARAQSVRASEPSYQTIVRPAPGTHQGSSGYTNAEKAKEPVVNLAAKEHVVEAARLRKERQEAADQAAMPGPQEVKTKATPDKSGPPPSQLETQGDPFAASKKEWAEGLRRVPPAQGPVKR